MTMGLPAILIVEDEGLIARDLQIRLRRLGYAVSGMVASGEEALQQAEANRPDVVLMDIALGGRMDGIQAAEQLRRRFNLPVVYLTAHTNEESIRRAKQTQPLGYILKPYEEQALRTTLEIALYKADMERRLHAALDELARSNQELEHFTSVASHDLREPLRTIHAYTQMVARRSGSHLDAESIKYLGYVTEAAVRMEAMIQGLLTYARIGQAATRRVSTDLAKVIPAVLQDLEVTLQESAATVTFHPLPTVSADPAQMHQLFQNLISNAAKYRGHDAPRIHLTAEPREGDWVIAVQDNGLGIGPQHTAKIFAPFQRLHHTTQYPGIGMGLAVCKKIVERHGGRIWVESRPGHGSTFYVALPARSPGDGSA